MSSSKSFSLIFVNLLSLISFMILIKHNLLEIIIVLLKQGPEEKKLPTEVNHIIL